MKEVKLREQPKDVFVDYLPEECVLGIRSQYGHKGWIQPTSFQSTTVQFMCVGGGVSSGNNWESYEGQMKANLNEWIKDGGKAYLFDSEEELFKWLSE